MMAGADPKYANLPGIAYDQPDFYETDDTPDLNVSYGDDCTSTLNNDNIEHFSIDHNRAFDAFKDSKVDASHTDFSDDFRYRRRCLGYHIPSTQYELNLPGCDRPETPLQKYQRLNVETNELLEELHRLKADKVTADRVDPELVKGVEVLSMQLAEMKLEEMLANDVLASLNDPQGLIVKELMSHVEQIKKPASKPGVPAGTQQQQDQMVYELHYKPGLAKLDNVSQVADIELRIQRLESLLGADDDQLKNLSSNTNQKSLSGAVSLLNAKLNLLEPSHLDQIETRLSALAVKLGQLADKKTSLEEAEKMSKVAQLFELVKNIEGLSLKLPSVTDRLVSLSELHEHALQFDQTLSQLSTTQLLLTENLAGNKKLLSQVQGTLDRNMDVMQKNLSNLNERVSALKK